MPLIRKSDRDAATALDQSSPGRSLDAASPDQRWLAARALGGAPGDVEILARALSGEPEARVREAILTSLARVGTLEAIDLIIDRLRSDDAGMRTGALDALRTIAVAVSPRMPALLCDQDPDVRILACEIARGLPQREATSLLSDLLDREANGNVCASAVEVLAEAGSDGALSALKRCAERFDAEPFLRFSIKVAMERLQGSPTAHSG